MKNKLCQDFNAHICAAFSNASDRESSSTKHYI